MFKGMRQVRLLRSATRKIQADDFDLDGALEDIFRYYETDPIFNSILGDFQANREDIEAIIVSMMAAGAAGTYRGHFVPISTVLYPATLSYVLRAHRGDIEKATAFYELDRYFESGAVSFEPEAAIRRQNPLAPVPKKGRPGYFIDPPGRFAPRREWMEFLQRLRNLPQDDPVVQMMIEDAEHVISVSKD